MIAEYSIALITLVGASVLHARIAGRPFVEMLTALAVGIAVLYGIGSLWLPNLTILKAILVVSLGDFVLLMTLGPLGDEDGVEEAAHE